MSKSPHSVLVDNIDRFGGGGADGAPIQRNGVLTKMSVQARSSNDDNALGSSIDHPRTLVFELASLVGQLSSIFLQKVPLDPPFEDLPPVNAASFNDNDKNNTNNDDDINLNSATDHDNDKSFSISRPNVIEDEEVKRAMGRILLKLIELGHSLSLKLGTVIVRKMELNKRKYPADLCRGKAGKYTEYSAITGITKEEGQSTLQQFEDNEDEDEEEETVMSFLESLERLTQDIGNFASERQWSRYHKPRNLLLALLGELGELAEIFQWRGDTITIDSISKKDMDKIGQELADVAVYLIRLSDVSDIDLKVAALSVLDSTDCN